MFVKIEISSKYRAAIDIVRQVVNFLLWQKLQYEKKLII